MNQIFFKNYKRENYKATGNQKNTLSLIYVSTWTTWTLSFLCPFLSNSPSMETELRAYWAKVQTKIMLCLLHTRVTKLPKSNEPHVLIFHKSICSVLEICREKTSMSKRHYFSPSELCSFIWKSTGHEKLNKKIYASNFKEVVDLRMELHPTTPRMGPKLTHWQSSIIHEISHLDRAKTQ